MFRFREVLGSNLGTNSKEIQRYFIELTCCLWCMEGLIMDQLINPKRDCGSELRLTYILLLLCLYRAY